jgi:hypothetical protein
VRISRLYSILSAFFLQNRSDLVAKLQSNDLRRYAVLGAEQRLLTLAEEAEQIYRAFPELRKGGPGGVRKSAPRGKAGRRRRKLSAEGRKRISDAQKARWARQRGETAAVGGGSAGRKKR